MKEQLLKTRGTPPAAAPEHQAASQEVLEVVEREGEDAREGDAATAVNTGRRRVDGHVELPEEVDAQDGPLYVCCDEGEVALMHG